MIGAALDPASESTIDLIQPFQLELSNVRGRIVRLNRVLADVLALHDYPLPVEQVVAEAMVAAVLLASLLSYEGVFTLQAKGDGAISLLVVDATSDGALRAYSRFDAEKLPAPGANATVERLFGEGYLAFTVDQGEHSEGYQGIVALTGATLTDCLEHYFAQSEQLPTAAKLAARRYPDGWRAGGVLLQHLPQEDAGRIIKNPAEDEEDWRRATLLMGTVAEVELLDRTLHLNNLLFRLFHEEQVRVFAPGAVRRGCRCSAPRVTRVLQSIPRLELDELRVDGEVVVTCEFCSTEYRFDDRALDALYGLPPASA
jgi:molecular chaperone Hsp33